MSTAERQQRPQNGTAAAVNEIVARQEATFTYKPLGESESITLTISRVRQFLCTPTRSGKWPDDEQVVKFIMLCKAQGLNPWVNDAYLVGYDSKDGPSFSLIVAHQALMKRAEASTEYDGMESGVVVENAEGLQYREGDLVLSSEKLIGGWAKVYRKDRKVPSYDALNLTTFNTNRSRWAIDPAGMIVKCAQASALRMAYPSNLAGLYCREEMEREIHQQPPSGEPVTNKQFATNSDRLASTLQSRANDNSDAEVDDARGEESQVNPSDASESNEHEQPSKTHEQWLAEISACTRISDVEYLKAQASKIDNPKMVSVMQCCDSRIAALKKPKSTAREPGQDG